MAAHPVSGTVAAPVWRIYLQLAAVALLWGGTFIAGRLLATDLPPFTAASGRFAVAAILLWLLARLHEGGLPRLTRRQMLSTALLGCSGIFLYNLCFFSALADMPASRTALFVALNPALTALAAALLLRERLATRQWGGIALALAGAWIIISRGEPVAAIHDLARAFGRGELMMLGAVTSWAAYTLVGRTGQSDARGSHRLSGRTGNSGGLCLVLPGGPPAGTGPYGSLQQPGTGLRRRTWRTDARRAGNGRHGRRRGTGDCRRVPDQPAAQLKSSSVQSGVRRPPMLRHPGRIVR